jgi:hypothetical protein
MIVFIIKISALNKYNIFPFMFFKSTTIFNYFIIIFCYDQIKRIKLNFDKKSNIYQKLIAK